MERLDFSPIIRSFLSDRRMMRLERVIHGGNILVTGLASLPCPASMLKQRLNAWKQHEMVMWSRKKDRTGQAGDKKRETFPFLSTTHPLFHVPSSCTCVCLSLMLLTSFYMDIFEINEKHCAKSWPYFMFWFLFFRHHSRHQYRLW